LGWSSQSKDSIFKSSSLITSFKTAIISLGVLFSVPAVLPPVLLLLPFYLFLSITDITWNEYNLIKKRATVEVALLGYLPNICFHSSFEKLGITV